jgi:hypothetical protein
VGCQKYVRAARSLDSVGQTRLTPSRGGRARSAGAGAGCSNGPREPGLGLPADPRRNATPRHPFLGDLGADDPHRHGLRPETERRRTSRRLRIRRDASPARTEGLRRPRDARCLGSRATVRAPLLARNRLRRDGAHRAILDRSWDALPLIPAAVRAGHPVPRILASSPSQSREVISVTTKKTTKAIST